MTLKNVLSFLLLMIFSTAYLLKLFILAKKYKIKANVLSQRNKEKSVWLVERNVKISSLIWIVVWALECLFQSMINNISFAFLQNTMLSILGIVINSIGVIIFILATISMKTSWRVGIDASTQTALVTTGLYKWSRNPAFVGFDLMFIGLFLTYMDALTFLVMALNIFTFHLLILQEEKYLLATFKDTYTKYKKTTARYFLFI